ncbi:phage tail protein [Rahnella variigena]|uniref:phage tail protein n=1 Tax=Rahnella variigena TaxID=574964 RepID=UPI00101BEC57|nr:phage tail protein [Rahnella variigena]RYJ17463.1 phage tail protein [Rahnella variigena]
MQKIGSITSTADANGEWTNGNVAAGTPPTILDAGWLNTVQRELANIVTGGGITLDPTNDAQVLSALKNILNGRLLGSPKVILASGNYTWSAGTRFIRVRAIAAGGGGGGCPATSSSQTGGSQAGFYGQFIDIIIPVSALTPSVAVVIGAGGAGGAAGSNSGSTGGSTSFGSIFTLGGGAGGGAGNVSTSSLVVGAGTTAGTLTSTITPLNSSGGISSSAQFVQVTPGTALGFTSTPSPIEGGLYGRGGEGKYLGASSSAASGGTGRTGVMIIEEYA